MLTKKYLSKVSLACLTEWDKNYRSITPAALSHLKNKIQEIGIFKPLLAISGAKPGTYQIIGGNQRLRAYRELGFESADLIFFPDLTDKKLIAKIALADNQSDGYTDPEKLLALCEDAALSLDDLTDFQLSDEDFSLADIFPQEDISPKYDEETPALTDTPAFTQPGDIFLLGGSHRLICGDSTDEETLKRLMREEQADLLLTDPPYNIDYEGAHGKKIANDKMSPTDFAAFLQVSMKNASRFLRQGASFYVWYADKESISFRQACEWAGLSIRQGLVWVKNHFVLGRQDYQWRHEPCLYGWKDGSPHFFIDDRTQSTVLEFDKPTKSTEHPTMKPVALFAMQIKNSTQEGDLVLDTFAGSGTSLIACELTGRKARLAELDPLYCDVIVKRFLALENVPAVEVLRNGKRRTVTLAAFGGSYA